MGAGASAGSAPGEALVLVGGRNAAGRVSGARDAALDSFLCPITGDIMSHPVMTFDGHTYEKAAIEEWLRRGHRTSPLTGLPLDSTAVTPNVTLKKAISEYQQLSNSSSSSNSSSGQLESGAQQRKKAAGGLSVLRRLGSSSMGAEEEKGEDRLERALDRAAAKAERVRVLLADPDVASPSEWLLLQTKLPPSEVRRYSSLLKRDGASSMALVVDAGYSRDDLQQLGVRQPHIASLLRAVREYKRQTGLKGPEEEEAEEYAASLGDDPLMLYCDDEEERLRRKLMLLRRRAAAAANASPLPPLLRSQRTMSLDEDDEDDEAGGLLDEDDEGGAFDDDVLGRHGAGVLRRAASSSFSAEPASYARRGSSSQARELREVVTAGEALRLMLSQQLAAEPSARQQQLMYQQQQMREDEEEMAERVQRAFADSPALMRALRHEEEGEGPVLAGGGGLPREFEDAHEEDEEGLQEMLDDEEEEEEEEEGDDVDSTRAIVVGPPSLPRAGGGGEGPAAPSSSTVLPVGSLTVRRLLALTREQLSAAGDGEEEEAEEGGGGPRVATLLEALTALGKLACSMGPEPAAFVRMACHLRRLGMELQPDVGQDAHLRYKLGCAGAVEVVVSVLQGHERDARVVGLAMRLLARLMLDDDNKDRLLLMLGAQSCGVGLLTGPMRRFPNDPHVQANGCLILADLDGSCPCQHHAASPAGRWLRTEDMALILAALRNLPHHADTQVCGLAACARLSDQQQDEDGDDRPGSTGASRASLFEEARELVAAARARFGDDQDVQLIARTVDHLLRQQRAAQAGSSVDA